MKTVETSNLALLARIFLKSTSHVRVRDTKGSYFRSIAVGLQFAAFLPYEIVAVVIWPLIRNIVGDLFIALDSLVFVVWSAISFMAIGFSGYLEATYLPVEEEIEDE